MKPRIIIVIILSAFAIGGVIFNAYTTHYLNQASDKTIIRTNEDYTHLIESRYPGTKGTLAITESKEIKKHWVMLKIKNKANNDVVRAIVNDPTNSVTSMRLVLGPSATFSNYDISRSNIPNDIYKELK